MRLAGSGGCWPGAGAPWVDFSAPAEAVVARDTPTLGRRCGWRTPETGVARNTGGSAHRNEPDPAEAMCGPSTRSGGVPVARVNGWAAIAPLDQAAFPAKRTDPTHNMSKHRGERCPHSCIQSETPGQIDRRGMGNVRDA